MEKFGKHKEIGMIIVLSIIVAFLLGLGLGWQVGFSDKQEIKQFVKTIVEKSEQSRNFASVKSMYEKFMLIDGGDNAPHLISDEKTVFRLKALSEELTELEDGYKEMDLEKIADALVDLVVFALGTAVIHNLPWEDLFNDVQRANMSKVPTFTNKKARNGGGSMDLVKPDGWVGPKTAEILKKYGWHGPV